MKEMFFAGVVIGILGVAGLIWIVLPALDITVYVVTGSGG
jgi:hypothetical protein